MEIELDRIRVFDVLRNTLNGELAVVMSVSGGLLDMRVASGEVVRFKFGPHFERIPDDEAIAFRTALREKRKEQEKASGKKRRPRSVNALLKRLAKKR